MAAGGLHMVAVLDSAVYAWGSNRCGQLGTRTFRDRDTPAEVRAPCLFRHTAAAHARLNLAGHPGAGCGHLCT